MIRLAQPPVPGNRCQNEDESYKQKTPKRTLRGLYLKSTDHGSTWFGVMVLPSEQAGGLPTVASV